MLTSASPIFLSAASVEQQKDLTFKANKEINPSRTSAAFTLIVDQSRKRFLFLRRSAESYFPLCWDLPGGFAEHEETAEMAAKREIFEEIGVELDSLIPWATYFACIQGQLS